MPGCPDGCRPEVLDELRWRASRPYIARHKKPDPVRAELRFNMAHCQRKGPPAFRSGKVVPITAHPRYQRAR